MTTTNEILKPTDDYLEQTEELLERTSELVEQANESYEPTDLDHEVTNAQDAAATETQDDPDSHSVVRYLFGIVCACGLSAWVYSDLSALESGEVESVILWAPIAMAYDFLGFWGAVSILPVLVVFLIFLDVKRHRQDSASTIES